MLRPALLAAFLSAPLHAQIYADFTVSSGGTPLGTFTVLLEHTKAPRTCANFIGLASGKRPWVDVTNGAVRTNKPYYDGLTFHRLDHDFVIQGGSPNGQGTDSPGYTILDEYHPELRHSSDYVLSMAKGGAPNTGGSQFFITLAATPGLNDKHSVFGKVISGTETIDGFRDQGNFPVEANSTNGAIDKPTTPIVMDSVVIRGPDYLAFDIDSPALRLPFVSGTEMAITRDAAASTMTATFNRKPQTEYLTLGSADLSAWSELGSVLSMEAQDAFQLTVDSRTEPRYFLNMATVDYGRIPNAPVDVAGGGKTLRIIFSGNGGSLDIKPNGSGGGTWSDTAGRSGTLAQTSWTDSVPATGAFPVDSPSAFFISLGSFSTILVNYPTAGNNGALNTWLSFHTPTGGWTEEFDGNQPNRFRFELLSN